MAANQGESMRIAMLDIESTALDATYGRILCACFKFLDEDKVRTVTARRYKDEPRALEQIAKLYNLVDIIVTWNGKLFDIPMLNARLMIRRKEHSVKPAILDPGKMHIDAMYQCKKLRTRGSRLDGCAKDLRLKRQKFEVEGEHWIRASDGDKESFDLIVRHCELDVQITEDAFLELKPYLVRISR